MSAPSLRKSLLIRCGTGVGVLLCVLCTGIYLSVKQNMYQELDNSIEQTAALLANQVELENGSITFEWQEGLGTNSALSEDGIFQFWKEGTDETTRSPALRTMDLKKFCGTEGNPQRRSINLPSGNRARAIGLRIHPFVLPEEMERMKASGRMIDPKSISYVLVVARDSEHIHRTLRWLRLVLAGGSLLTLAAGFLLIDRGIRVSLRPINDLARQVRNRAEHQLDSALDVPGSTPAELVGLAKNLDTLLARLASVRQRERDFIRHAAHELRTPIAGLRATTELALSQDRTTEEYRRHLATCQSTAMELGELIKRLSALARIGQTVEAQALESFDIVEKLGICLEPFRGLFHERGLLLETDTGGGKIPVAGDPSLARIIFNNLFDNALCYTRPGGTVRISVAETTAGVEIRVSNPTDSPPGTPEQWFEPLFRKNPSRDDAESHLGIGLTLSLNAANAMGWKLRAETPGEDRIELVLGIPRTEQENPGVA
ncbi:MAG: histidine kinase dimerization/phospho-acceptor domain-containing protein [Luteolibacter sp.]